MAKRYNPPPGWQVPAGSWRPSFAWQPDPAWPPAPVGWMFWVEQERDPAVVSAAPSRISRGYLGAAIGAVVLAALIAVGTVAVVRGSGGGTGDADTSVALAVASSPQLTTPAAVIPTPAPSSLTVSAKAKVKAKPIGSGSRGAVHQTRPGQAARAGVTPVTKRTVAKPAHQRTSDGAPSQGRTPTQPTTPSSGHHHRYPGGFPNFFWFLPHHH